MWCQTMPHHALGFPLLNVQVGHLPFVPSGVLVHWYAQSSCTLQGVRDQEAPETSPKAGPTLKERLAEALREIERLQAALEEANQQQEWVLGNVVKISEAEKEELTRALQ